MSLDWPFYEQESLLILECPDCSNQRLFQARRERERLWWQCGCCGNSATLHLSKIPGSAALVDRRQPLAAMPSLNC